MAQGGVGERGEGGDEEIEEGGAAKRVCGSLRTVGRESVLLARCSSFAALK